jgi:hypothetical protein
MQHQHFCFIRNVDILFFMHFLKFILRFLKIKSGHSIMVHSCNPSYSGGRDQEDWGLKPAWANSCETLSWKNPSQIRAGEWIKM